MFCVLSELKPFSCLLLLRLRSTTVIALNGCAYARRRTYVRNTRTAEKRLLQHSASNIRRCVRDQQDSII